MADTQVDVTRRIAAPASTVWQMVSDVTRMGEWSPETTAATWSKGANGPTLGARFSGKNRNGRRTWSTVCTVDQCEPDRTFGFTVAAGPLKVARWSYRIEPEINQEINQEIEGGQGREAGLACTVTETWIDQRGWLVRRLGKPLSGVADRASHNRAGMERTLERLAAAAEGAAA
jgi:uncharacterized protein YndB with AHSA1/START domain